jgi:cohesin complex subunit SA-1/2
MAAHRWCYVSCDILIWVWLIFCLFPFQVVGLLLQNMHIHLAWSLQSVIDGESVSDASLTSLRSKRDTLLQELEYYVNFATDSNEGDKIGSELAGRVREL